MTLLKDFLLEKRPAILAGWLESILEAYPEGSRDFFRNKGDSFSNPIGSTLRQGIEKLYQEILHPTDAAISGSLLGPIIRIRALENLLPSQAIGFIPLLKEIIKEGLEGRFLESPYFREWLILSDTIDRLTLQAFDIYMECREKVHQLKVKELKSAMGKIREERGPKGRPPEDR